MPKDVVYSCSKCGAVLSPEHLQEWNGRILKACPYCHYVESVEEDPHVTVERIKSQRISQIENRRMDIQERAMRRERFKRPEWLQETIEIFGPIVLIFGSMFLIIGIVLFWNISPPEDAGYYRGKEVTESVRSFRDAGFFKVSTVPIADGRNVGRVDHVTINGESEFYADSVFLLHGRSEYGRNASVVIYYHTEKPK